MIRQAAHAGTFYPRFKEQVVKQIEQWIQDAEPGDPKQRSFGLILPHAGYMYSGQCAALGLHSVSHEYFDSVVILHPSHQGHHFDFSLSPFTEYVNPLGVLKLDSELYQKLAAHADQDISLSLHQNEHSMEIQLPLINYFFPHVAILPIMIGNQIPAVAKRLAGLLHDALFKSSRRVLVICSTDLSHYHSAKKGEGLDTKLITEVLAMQPERLWDAVQKGDCEACGIGAILTLLYMAELYSAPEAKLVSYTHSGRVSGDNSRVVGYLAARMYI